MVYMCIGLDSYLSLYQKLRITYDIYYNSIISNKINLKAFCNKIIGCHAK